MLRSAGLLLLSLPEPRTLLPPSVYSHGHEVNPAALAAMLLPSVPPIRHGAGETTLERQSRIRPSATPPVTSDGDLNNCAIYLDRFMHRDK
eukprot:6899117-Pyramimonas_sp.AAC.1